MRCESVLQSVCVYVMSGRAGTAAADKGMSGCGARAGGVPIRHAAAVRQFASRSAGPRRRPAVARASRFRVRTYLCRSHPTSCNRKAKQSAHKQCLPACSAQLCRQSAGQPPTQSETGTASLRRARRPGKKRKKNEKKLTNRGSRDESQRIAAWKLLYRVRHPGPCVSRLQTIPHSDVGSSRNLDPKETGSLLCRGPQLSGGARVAPDASASGFSHRTATGVPRQTAADRGPQRR